MTSILFLFVPKCALCWAAYMSLFSSIGLTIHYRAWFVPAAVILFLLTFAKLLIDSVAKKNYFAFALATVAGIMIIMQRSEIGLNNGKLFALVLMAIAVLMDKIIYLVKFMGYFLNSTRYSDK